MALAPVAYCLWQQFLRYDPDRSALAQSRPLRALDRPCVDAALFAVSSGRRARRSAADGKTLSTPAVSLDDIKNFRQLGSKSPGHPEYGMTTGVETTTGPLGQGVANSVGMAIAERWLAAHFNRPGFDLFDYDVYALCGDGDMMEGISAEAASLAGHLKLSNLCWIYDNNHITIEGDTDLAFTKTSPRASPPTAGTCTHVDDANDLERSRAGVKRFQQTNDRPTLIIVDSHIGYGSPHKQDTKEAHGEPLGEEEIKLTKRSLRLARRRQVPRSRRRLENFSEASASAARNCATHGSRTFDEYKAQYPDLADQLDQMQHRELPDGWDKDLPDFPADAKGMATRDASGKVLNAIAKNVPWLIGGSADLAPSTKTRLTFEGAGDFEPGQLRRPQLPLRHSRTRHGRDRQRHGAVEGPALTARRSSSSATTCGRRSVSRRIMEIPVIYVFTHDSIGVGEDGPTHQPIEQLASLRAIPGLIDCCARPTPTKSSKRGRSSCSFSTSRPRWS